MERGLRVTPEAKKQIRDANAWWVANRSAAPHLIRTELERAFLLITSQPRVGSPALDPDLDPVRRILLYRIGYHLYYRIALDSTVHVLGLWHTSRGVAPPL
ncbi:MAG: type II toxin-antitoxin system RelE/ParE family toxin [Thermoanaerobaculia bacterium]|nr:type II toxin-antitoxin system RelE/ParE family toxin [Thermoanaerobaculia bacterium]MBP9826823.1 type II toxin-antitoxin system RelE/ParE family toxin [Thermoanaerobaculia bacterium]